MNSINTILQNFKNQTLKGKLKILWLFIFIPGIIGLLMRVITGERMVAYGSYVPWGLWIALYFHAIGISGGSFAVGAIGYLRGITGLKEKLHITLLISSVSLLTGLLTIWLDLGHPIRAYRVMISPNFGSMLTFNAWMYGIFLCLVVCIFYFNQFHLHKSNTSTASNWLVPLLCLGIFLSIAYPSQSGAFFGVVDAKPFWSSAILPVLFLTSAVTSGSAALLLVHYYLLGENIIPADPFVEPFTFLRKITLIGIGVYFLGEFSEYSLALWSPISHIKEYILLIMFGTYWWVFWIIHVAASFAGFYLLFMNKSVNQLALGAFIIVTSFISTRLNILIPGQSIPEIKGLNTAFTHPRLSFHYSPSIVEFLIALFVISFGLALFSIGLYVVIPYIHKKLGESNEE